MCGILGFFDPTSAVFDEAAAHVALNRGLDLLRHRGPDAGAVVVWPQRRLGFGHRRLSILDLSNRANQPMTSPDGKVSVTYNGEIYNFAALKKELEAGGIRFTTTSDTEVLLLGYQHWGLAGLLKRAAGMFAFALWDDSVGKLFLVRDRAGKKPLYFAQDRGAWSFGSELAAVQALRPKRADISKQGLEAFLTLKFAPSPLTLVEGLEKVPPGHFLEISNAGRRLMPYWSALGGSLPEGAPADLVDNALGVAARRRLVSDVPVCLFLSGGIDSSLIVHKIAEAGAVGTAAYTIGYDDMPGYNEFDYARMVANKYPVTLYSAPKCVSCDTGRALLTARGIPFNERTVTTPEDGDYLQRLSGETSLPLLSIGSQRIKGFIEPEWTQYLDAAGYPKTSVLTATYKNPAPTPLVSVQKAAPPAAKAEEKPQQPYGASAPPATSPANPAGIQF